MAAVRCTPRLPAPGGARRRRAGGGPPWSTGPRSDLPGGRGSRRRTSARLRRARGARRARHGAFSRSRSAVLIPPAPGARRRRVSTRAGVPALMRRAVATPRRRSSRLPTGALTIGGHGRRRGRPPCPAGPGSPKVARRARRSDTTPSVPIPSGRRAAPRLTRAIRRRLRGRSRGALTAPARPKRGLPSSASAIHPRPPGVLPRLASAWTCPSAQGGATRGSGTAWP